MIPRRRYDWATRLTADLRAASQLSHAQNSEALPTFERKLGDYLRPGETDTLFLRGFDLGRHALVALLQAAKLPKGARIIIPAYTLGALGPLLETLGFVPQLCDVAAHTPIMTPESVADAWHADVRAVLVTHLFGQVVDVDAIREMAIEHEAWLIEDAAHALGARYKHSQVGALCDGSLISFDMLKPINTGGGGMAVAVHPDLQRALSAEAAPPPQPIAEALKSLVAGRQEDLLFAGPWLRLPTGLLANPHTRPLMQALDKATRRKTAPPAPMGLNALKADIGLASLNGLEARLDRRRMLARRILAALDLHDPQLAENAATRSNAYFVVVKAAKGEDANALRRKLWRLGVDAGIGDEVADDLSGHYGAACPNARDWFARAVQLPLYTGMRERTLRSLSRKLAKLRGKLVLD